MGPQTVQPNGIVQYLIPVVIVGILFAFRARRMTRVRPLKLGQLWIVPALYLFIVAGAFVANPPQPIGWVVALVGVVVGAAIGWWRGKTIAIHVDPATRTLAQKASPASILFLLFVIVAKSAARAGGGAAHIDVATLTDAVLGLALGTFVAMRIEMYLRAKRLLRDSLAATFS